jgi:hypothetical protein
MTPLSRRATGNGRDALARLDSGPCVLAEAKGHVPEAYQDGCGVSPTQPSGCVDAGRGAGRFMALPPARPDPTRNHISNAEAMPGDSRWGLTFR